MNTLLCFIITFFFPGVGQLLLKQYQIGMLITSSWLISILLANNLDFLHYLIPIVIHFAFLIWAMFDMFDRIESLEGRKSATRKLAFSTIIVLVLVPVSFYLLFGGLFKGSEFLVDKYLNEDRTKTEMNKISTALERYKDHYGFYPEDYNAFFSVKPPRAGWGADGWKNPYQYKLSDSLNYRLISAGKDEVFNTSDDIIRSN